MDHRTSVHDTQFLDKESLSLRLMVTAFLQYLYQFFRLSEIHNHQNKIFERALTELIAGINPIKQQANMRDLEIRFAGEQIYVNEIRIRPRARQFHINRFLCRFMRERQLSALNIPTTSSPDELKKFLWTIVQMKSNEIDEDQPIWSYVQTQGTQGLSVTPLSGIDGKKQIEDLELIGVLLHEKIRSFVQVCFDNRARAVDFDLPPLKTLMKDLMQLGEDDLLQVFRLKMMSREDKRDSALATDAAFLAAAWGKSLGLPQGVVQDLAWTALMSGAVHIIRGDMTWTPASNAEIEKLLLFQSDIEKIWPMDSLQSLGSYEWTFPFGDGGVYSPNQTKCFAHFFSRMIRIVARFQYIMMKEGLLPDETMAELLKSKDDMDPTLLKLFVNWMGIYPIGTLLLLQSGEVAQVFAAGADPLRFRRPIVSILKSAEGKILPRPELVDLMEMNDRLGIYRRTIKKTISLEEAGIPATILNVMPVGL